MRYSRPRMEGPVRSINNRITEANEEVVVIGHVGCCNHSIFQNHKDHFTQEAQDVEGILLNYQRLREGGQTPVVAQRDS